MAIILCSHQDEAIGRRTRSPICEKEQTWQTRRLRQEVDADQVVGVERRRGGCHRPSVQAQDAGNEADLRSPPQFHPGLDHLSANLVSSRLVFARLFILRRATPTLTYFYYYNPFISY